MPPHALVHGGFFYSYNASFLAANVSAAVAELVAERAAAPRGGGGGAGGGWRRRAALGASAAPTVFVTGHSLGGALARLCALSLRLDLGLPDVRVVTFGSPRVGNGVFAAWFDSAVGPHWRFTHDRDIVPSLPPGYLWFAHVGGEVWVVDRLLRGRTLVGVCADGGGAGEDARCHASVCHLGLCASLADHLLYLSEMYSPHPDGC
jgi:acetyl esterase/lipase